MELRSFNVERLWNLCVKCSIGEDLGIDKEAFESNIPNIKDMLSQIRTFGGFVSVRHSCVRKDDETWTPYLQIVEMLVRMGRKAGFVEYSGKLTSETLIKIKL